MPLKSKNVVFIKDFDLIIGGKLRNPTFGNILWSLIRKWINFWNLKSVRLRILNWLLGESLNLLLGESFEIQLLAIFYLQFEKNINYFFWNQRNSIIKDVDLKGLLGETFKSEV